MKTCYRVIRVKIEGEKPISAHSLASGIRASLGPDWFRDDDAGKYFYITEIEGIEPEPMEELAGQMRRLITALKPKCTHRKDREALAALDKGIAVLDQFITTPEPEPA